MSPAVEAQDLIRVIAGPMPAGSQIQGMLTAVARDTRISFRRLQAFWHGAARAIRSEEMDALRNAARVKREAREAHDRQEFWTVCAQLAALEQRMDALAAQLAGTTADGQGAAPARQGAPDRTVAGGVTS